MKNNHGFAGSVAALLLAAGVCFGQTSTPAVPSDQPASGPAANPEVRLSEAQLDDLTGPIALYPDPLIAQILPAATFPTDIVLAARMIARNSTTQEIDAQQWDPSVKAVARYPSIIKMMDDRLDWTQQLGAAFVRQPEDVMDSVQRLRLKARALGHLKDTEQQQVIIEEPQPQTTVVRIVPASTQVVYVPAYDPEIVYVRPYTASYVASPYIWFGAGFAIGSWLNLDCDWYSRRCYYPVGWSWSYCAYPSWRWHFRWHSGSSYWHGHHDYWCPPSYRVSYWGRHHDRHFDSGHHYAHRDIWGRTNDAYVRSNDSSFSSSRAWARDTSRPAPHLRANAPEGGWNVPNHRRTSDALAAGEGDSNRRSGIVADARPDRRTVDSAPRRDTIDAGRGVTSDSLKRTYSPDQIRDRLSRTTPRDTTSLRRDTSPRASDRTVPTLPTTRNARPDVRTPSVTDSLKRTRQLPPATTNRRSDTGAINVPGSGDVRGTPRIRTVNPSSRQVAPSTPRSSSPSASPSPSTGRRGLSLAPQSRGGNSAPRASSPSPARQVAPRSSPSPSRSAPAPSRGSTPNNRRSK